MRVLICLSVFWNDQTGLAVGVLLRLGCGVLQESVSEVGPPALSSRPPSPAPSAGLPPAAGSTSEEARSRVSSLPPAVLRRAQQLPGAIPLPNGHQVGVCSCLPLHTYP